MRIATLLCSSTLLAAAIIVPAGIAEAAVIYGVQPSTGQIVQVDTLTGNIVGGFTAPGTLLPSDTAIGLTGAEGGSVLLYLNSNDSADTMYRIDAASGSVLTTIAVEAWETDGLSYARIANQDYVYRSHSSGFGGDMHRMNGYGGGETFFFTGGTVLGGVGGDGNGRQFAYYSDGTIREFDEANGSFLNQFISPVPMVGLAYDGVALYASSSDGSLFTLDSNNGQILNRVTVAGGPLLGLGAAESQVVPEPSSVVLAGLGLAGLVGVRLRRRAAWA